MIQLGLNGYFTSIENKKEEKKFQKETFNDILNGLTSIKILYLFNN